MIADSQVHIWGPNTPERPWAAGREPHRAVPLGADELLRLMDEAGVHRAVLIPPSWDAARNDLVLEAAQRHPKRMFWGTDLARLPCSYRQAVTMFTEEIPWFTPEDKEWIMGRGLCEWLGWELRGA